MITVEAFVHLAIIFNLTWIDIGKTPVYAFSSICGFLVMKESQSEFLLQLVDVNHVVLFDVYVEITNNEQVADDLFVCIHLEMSSEKRFEFVPETSSRIARMVVDVAYVNWGAIL